MLNPDTCLKKGMQVIVGICGRLGISKFTLEKFTAIVTAAALLSYAWSIRSNAVLNFSAAFLLIITVPAIWAAYRDEGRLERGEDIEPVQGGWMLTAQRIVGLVLIAATFLYAEKLLIIGALAFEMWAYLILCDPWKSLDDR